MEVRFVTIKISIWKRDSKFDDTKEDSMMDNRGAEIRKCKDIYLGT